MFIALVFTILCVKKSLKGNIYLQKFTQIYYIFFKNTKSFTLFFLFFLLKSQWRGKLSLYYTHNNNL